MTRLTEILFPVAVIGTIWASLVFEIIPIALPIVWWNVLIALPAYLLITFGCYSLATVGYNVYCIRSDDGATQALKLDIEEAQSDLKKKGFNFE